MQQFPIGQSVPHIIGEASHLPIETGTPDVTAVRRPDQSFEEILLRMAAKSTPVASEEQKIIVNLADETVILPEHSNNAPNLVPPDKDTLSDWIRSDHAADASLEQGPSFELAPMMPDPLPESSSDDPILQSGTTLITPTESRTRLSPADDSSPKEFALRASFAPVADLKVEEAISIPSVGVNRRDPEKIVATLGAVPAPKAISQRPMVPGPAEFATPPASMMPDSTRALLALPGALSEVVIRSAPEAGWAGNVLARASEMNVKMGMAAATPAASQLPVTNEMRGVNSRTFTPELVGIAATPPEGMRASTVGQPVPDDSLAPPRIVPQITNLVLPTQSPASAAFEGERIQWTEIGNDLDAIPDLRATSETQTAPRGTIDSVFLRPELPRHISQQIMEALQRSASRQVDLHLNPVELGRVKISLQTADGSVTVHIAADRPDTADLLRRHLNLLAQEFRDIGFQDASFAFADRHPDGRADDRDSSNRAPSRESGDQIASGPNVTNEVPPVTLELGDRLDIRI